ncbi:autotransporter family protein [Bartonella gliris]|uniref:autotransporter family protein n=1 Tax=Bartonella gliris TaxID=3004109 RepID=UPI00295E49EE|nr:autotransporter outer membrane beta-barrel domain-containing protein [Bartonella gliris]
MIKVFRNHLCLCTFTTAILSLLQNGVGAGASVEKRDKFYPKVIEIDVTPINEYAIDGHEVPVVYNNSFMGVEGGSGFINLDYNSVSGGSRENGSAYGYESEDANGQRLFLYDGEYYICDNCGENTINNRSYNYKKVIDGNVASSTAITVKGIGTKVSGKNVTVSSKTSDESFLLGVSVLEGGKIVLENPILKNTAVALHANDGIIEINKGVVRESQRGVDVIGNSFVVLEDTEIKTGNGQASLLSYGGSEIKMKGGSVDFVNSNGVSSTLGGVVTFDSVSITGRDEERNQKNHAVFRVDVGGLVNFKGTIDVTNAHGILSENTVSTFNSVLLPDNLSNRRHMTEVNITSSSVTVNGEKSYGIYFRGEKNLIEYGHEESALQRENTPPRLEAVNIRRTMFSVPDSVALYSTDSTYGIVNLMQSTLSGRELLRAEKGALVKVLASASTLEGSAYVDDHSTAELYLGDGSTWILKQKQERDSDESARTNDSSVSYLLLMSKSSINFKKRKSDSNYDYQTLRIGDGMGTAYKVQDGANIHLNTYLNEGGDLNKQKTDRVLIHGDVEGTTTVHVHGVSGSPGGSTGSGGNNQGISIIQVSGTAEKDSFQLKGGYVTLDGTPYQYRLNAYGVKSDLGGANTTQRLVKGEGEFWDFRLENRYISPDPGPVPAPEPHPFPPSEPGVKAVVPQVSTYLLLPNALFHTGLMSISSQGKRLEELRITSGGVLESDENPAFFVRSYSGSHRYLSNLSALEYGYGGELDYNALEAGVLLKTIENAYGATSFGVIGSYERFSLQPHDVEQSQKSAFDKWSVTAYGGMMHDAGFYVDGLLSYGLFKGDVLTLARGKTATLKGNPLSASLTTGKAFMIGDEGFVFDPQVQVVYQRLQFNKVRDIDDFDIEMGKLDQWTARVGGRLTKTFAATDEARVVSLYGKLHLAHNFGVKQFVHFKDPFQLGALGSSLETGLGFNARLSPKFALHGDLIYQHKLTKAGFSGTSFSGGLRYHF